MATHQGDESLKHPMVAKFGSTNGAQKQSKDNKADMQSAGEGTTFAPGPMRPNKTGGARP